MDKSFNDSSSAEGVLPPYVWLVSFIVKIILVVLQVLLLYIVRGSTIDLSIIVLTSDRISRICVAKVLALMTIFLD